MPSAKKVIGDLKGHESLINKIDIATEKLLSKQVDEAVRKTINQTREKMLFKLKEIDRFNLSNKERQFVYFVQGRKSNHDESFDKDQKKSENLLGNLVILNQDLSHLFKKLR